MAALQGAGLQAADVRAVGDGGLLGQLALRRPGSLTSEQGKTAGFRGISSYVDQTKG